MTAAGRCRDGGPNAAPGGSVRVNRAVTAPSLQISHCHWIEIVVGECDESKTAAAKLDDLVDDGADAPLSRLLAVCASKRSRVLSVMHGRPYEVGVAPARANSHRGVITPTPNDRWLGFTRWTVILRARRQDVGRMHLGGPLN
jgi:hypothetical protein